MAAAGSTLRPGSNMQVREQNFVAGPSAEKAEDDPPKKKFKGFQTLQMLESVLQKPEK